MQFYNNLFKTCLFSEMTLLGIVWSKLSQGSGREGSLHLIINSMNPSKVIVSYNWDIGIQEN